ncbi:MAG: hypothetical protein Q9227_001878 [Pyrenula ochraceoflavens]
MPFGWGESQDAHQQVYGDGGYENQAKFSHELIAGKQVSHAFAKELLAGFVGGEVDKLAETKGMDTYDRHEARKHAKESAERMYDDHYISQEGADQYDPNRYGRPGRLDY